LSLVENASSAGAENTDLVTVESDGVVEASRGISVGMDLACCGRRARFTAAFVIGVGSMGGSGRIVSAREEACMKMVWRLEGPLL
jgi:hypothetical protein